MRLPFWTAAMLGMTCLMAGCGGGGGGGDDIGSGNTGQTMTAATCDSNVLWPGGVVGSGLLIPDASPTGVTVNWDNQTCALQTVSSASLEICLGHPRPSDLQWTITSPSSGTPLPISAPVDWSMPSTPCDSGQGQLQRIDLLPTVQSTVTTRGIWALKVNDASAGVTGTLTHWRVIIEGTR
jgi:subtilisin-like proprotein convertase family protein